MMFQRNHLLFHGIDPDPAIIAVQLGKKGTDGNLAALYLTEHAVHVIQVLHPSGQTITLCQLHRRPPEAYPLHPATEEDFITYGIHTCIIT